MRITSVDINAANSNTINLSFRDPTAQNPYMVKAIIGLDADEIVPKFYGTSHSENQKYYNLSRQPRDIVARIELNPDFSLGKSYSELRDDLYRIISSSRTGAIQLLFKDGETAVATISGFVTKFEASHFTQTPEVQITINCKEPMLKALDEVNVDISELDPSLTVVTDDQSTAPHGVRFGMIFTSPIVDFFVQDASIPNWAFEVNLTGSPLLEFATGDELHFSSEINNQYLYLIRDLEIFHLVDKIVPTSIWPVIFPGDNAFVCSENVNWDYITYYPTYWGV